MPNQPKPKSQSNPILRPHCASPKYRRQKRAGGDLAFVVLDGQRHYLGKYGTRVSREAYHRLLAEWSASDGRMSIEPQRLTIIELVARYWSHAQVHYRKPDGTPTSSITRVKAALGPIRDLYGMTKAADFGPNALRAVRQTWIDKGLARTTINDQTAQIKLMFKWAASHELIPSATCYALQSVTGLRRGRSEARESAPIKPVDLQDVDAIQPFVSRQVWALIQLQLLTAARGGELFGMRAIDMDMRGDVWEYRPAKHKTQHHGHDRVIFIGPNGQQLMQPFLVDRSMEKPLFSPRDAVQDQAQKAQSHRRVNQRPNARRTTRVVRDTYSRDSYSRAISRACKKAGVSHWHPHQLRHTAATYIRRNEGLEVARIILGHRSLAMAEWYAEVDHRKAVEFVSRTG